MTTTPHIKQASDIGRIPNNCPNEQEVLVPLGVLRDLYELYLQQVSLEAQRAVQQRIELIVETLFPAYHWQLDESEKPIIHPQKAWWWNGASIIEQDELANGDCKVEVRSYIGKGNYDTFKFTIPSIWISDSDPVPLVHEWCKAEKKRLLCARQRDELASAWRRVLESISRLEHLVGYDSSRKV